MRPPLERNLGSDWWLTRGAYFRVMLRELSSVFIGAYLVFFLILLYKVGEGPAAYVAYREFLWSPGMRIFHLFVLAFSLLHTISWFNLTPKAMVIRRGEDKLPDVMVAGPNYVIWATVTAFLLWIVLK